MKWLSFLLVFNIQASTFFVPDSDTAVLVSLVSNTASTVSNTLKILEVAKETSQKMDEYNFLAMRRYFIARRVEQHANDMAKISKMKPKKLKELNRAMLALKMNLKGLKSNIDFMAKDVFHAEDFTQKYYAKVMNAKEDAVEAHSQENLSASSGTYSKHIQNTAMNTALSSTILSKIRLDNAEFQKNSIAIKNGQLKEKLRREEFYKKWLGIKNENN